MNNYRRLNFFLIFIIASFLIDFRFSVIFTVFLVLLEIIYLIFKGNKND
jgi:Ca2+/Na+ antiporter